MSKKTFYALVAAAALCAGTAFAAGNTLTVANTYDAKTLDPIGANEVAASGMNIHIYDTLLDLDVKGNLGPRLATDWEVKDPTTLVFHLRKDVKFHNGDPMTSADVKYSLDRARGPEGSSIHQYSQLVDNVETPDDYTVVIHLKEPNTPFLMILTHPWASVLSKRAVEEKGEAYGMNPVGTGPYKLESWKKGDRITLVRNEDYWGEKPNIEKIVMRSVPESNSRTIALESGDVDIAFEISPVDIKRLEDNPNINVTRDFTSSTTYLGINTSKEKLKDKKVRQALWHALDVPTIHEAAWHGVGSVPKAPMAPSILYAADDLPQYEFNPEKAKQMLEEAGVKDLKLDIWTNELQQRQDMAQMVQAYLAAIGVQSEIKVLEWGAYLSGLEERNHDLFLLGWSASVPDPDVCLTGVFATDAPSNYSYFSSPKLDELLAKGRTLENGDERKQVYRDAQMEIIDQVPWIYMHVDEKVIGTQKNVKNFVMDPRGYQYLGNVSFE